MARGLSSMTIPAGGGNAQAGGKAAESGLPGEAASLLDVQVVLLCSGWEEKWVRSVNFDLSTQRGGGGAAGDADGCTDESIMPAPLYIREKAWLEVRRLFSVKNSEMLM